MSVATKIPARSEVDTQAFAVLLQRLEQGHPVPLAELERFSRSDDSVIRATAKRLLARWHLQQAQRVSLQLLADACRDSGFADTSLLLETIAGAETLADHEQVYELLLSAAEHAAGRGDLLTALLNLMNAGSTDFQHGGRHIANPDDIRRIVAVYEEVAPRAAAALGVRPAARGVRRSPPDEPLRMAYVVGQLVDGAHSTSRVFRTALTHADRQRFRNYVFVTDVLVKLDEHAFQMFHSPPSAQRAPQTICHFQQKLGVPVILPESRRSALAVAAELHHRMAEHQIDIAFFHGSIITPTDWMLCAWQAAPWQFDLGFGTPLHCPAVDHQFFEFADTMEKLAFLCRERGVACSTSPYSGSDMTDVEAAAPLARSQYGIPDDHIVLGTISNHAAQRMSPAFCRTVASVLRAHPRTTYVVVGPGPFPVQTSIFGPDLCGGAAPRVKFVGCTSQVGAMTKMFDIYVNEYPAGGGLTVLGAMAARVPVIAMQLEQTGLAAVGRLYLGDENLVQPPTDAAYAARLSRLITDRAERERLGHALYDRYRVYFTGRKWAEDICNRIYETVQVDLSRPVAAGPAASAPG